MNHFVIALSAIVSEINSWLLISVTGMAYKIGASAVWAVAGYINVEFFLFFYYTRWLRRIKTHYDCVTLLDFLPQDLVIKQALCARYSPLSFYFL